MQHTGPEEGQPRARLVPNGQHTGTCSLSHLELGLLPCLLHSQPLPGGVPGSYLLGFDPVEKKKGSVIHVSGLTASHCLCHSPARNLLSGHFLGFGQAHCKLIPGARDGSAPFRVCVLSVGMGLGHLRKIKGDLTIGRAHGSWEHQHWTPTDVTLAMAA